MSGVLKNHDNDDDVDSTGGFSFFIF